MPTADMMPKMPAPHAEPQSTESQPTESLARIVAAVGPGGYVQIDLPCRRCSYNLRSLARTARCPECDFPVELALRHGDLAYSAPAYVARLAVGAHLLCIGPTAGFACFFISPINTAAPLLRFASFVTIVVGAWLVTGADPSGLGEDDYGRARKLPRALLTLGLLVFPLGLLARTTTSAAAAGVLDLLTVLAYVSAFAGVLALIHYLRRLGFRMGNATIISQLSICFRGTLLCVPPLVLMYLIHAKVGAVSPALAVPLAVVAAAAVMGLIFTSIAFVAGMFTVASALRADARVAKQLWSAAQAGHGLPDRFT